MAGDISGSAVPTIFITNNEVLSHVFPAKVLSPLPLRLLISVLPKWGYSFKSSLSMQKIQECQAEIRSVVQQLVKSVVVDGPNTDQVFLVEGGLTILCGLCDDGIAPMDV